MKKFGLVLDDSLYNDFRKYFMDHGQRTSILRRCVFKLVAKARESGYVSRDEAYKIAESVFQDTIGGSQNELT